MKLLRATIFVSPINDVGTDVRHANLVQITVGRGRAAKDPSIRVVKVRIEKRPAREGAARPQLAALLREAENMELDVVIVDRIRRLATPPSKAVAIVEQFKALGVEVLSAKRDDGRAAAAAINRHGLGS